MQSDDRHTKESGGGSGSASSEAPSATGRITRERLWRSGSAEAAPGRWVALF
jgi:hypothetical protein